MYAYNLSEVICFRLLMPWFFFLTFKGVQLTTPHCAVLHSLLILYRLFKESHFGDLTSCRKKNLVIGLLSKVRKSLLAAQTLFMS